MRLKEKYKKEILQAIKDKFGLKNDLEVPRMEKVVINVGFGKHFKEKAYISNIEKGLAKIAGQKCVFAKARKSISAFKVREGMIIGAMVTLRGARMYDFVDKLVNITFPRVRDFRGINMKSVDSNGNITVGFKEHTAFPEITPEMTDNIHGLEISIATSIKNREYGLELFKLIGFPFKKENS